MTVGRITGVALILTAVGLAVVEIRTHQVALARRVAQLHRDRTRLERELWHQELTIARLRGPNVVRDRAARLTAGQVAAGTHPVAGPPSPIAAR